MNRTAGKLPANHAADEVKVRSYQRVVSALGTSIARLMQVANKPVLEFIPSFKAGLIDALLAENPRMPISELAIRTGIDRRHVSAYLRKHRLPARRRRNKIAMILSHLAREAQHTPDGLIACKGGPHSFEAICKRYASGDYSPGAVLKELKRQGCVTEEAGHIRLLRPYFRAHEDDMAFLGYVVWVIRELVNTALHNHRTPAKANRKFQRSIYSSQIPFEKRAQVERQLKELLEKQYAEIYQVLKQNEIDVAVGTFEPVGVSMFQFGPSESLGHHTQQKVD